MKKKNKIVKLKRRNSVVKRFKLTKRGKLLRRRGQLRHLRANRTKSNRRRHRRLQLTKGKIAKKIKKMLAA